MGENMARKLYGKFLFQGIFEVKKKTETAKKF